MNDNVAKAACGAEYDSETDTIQIWTTCAVSTLQDGTGGWFSLSRNDAIHLKYLIEEAVEEQRIHRTGGHIQ
jgi:hypothetical protein